MAVQVGIIVVCVSGVHGLSVYADRPGWIHTRVPDRAAGRHPTQPAGAPPTRYFYRGHRLHSDRGERARVHLHLHSYPTKP